MKLQRSSTVKLTAFIFLVILLIFSFFFKNKAVFNFYEQYIFLPYQKLRSSVLNHIGFSVGDIFYLIVAIILLISIFRFFRYLILFSKNRFGLGKLLLNSTLSLLFVYVLYFFSWGGNYSRQKIWKPSQDTLWNQQRLEALNDTLINGLNQLQFSDSGLSLNSMNKKVRGVYQSQIGTDVPDLKVKPSLFGNAIYYFGIQGYYNPITGEAQFAKSLPPFMWGFVIAHEMAHQTGIAAEGEANFMAYVMCVKSDDTQLKYAAFFNLFLYANRELAKTDSAMAAEKKALLNADVKKNLDILEVHRKQYRSIFRGTILSIYDWMLQSQGQTKGLKSYADISRLVYFWEQAGEPDIRLFYNK